MISPFRFVSIKSLPHRAVGVSLFRCCCCYSRCCCCCCSSCVINFVRFSILRSLLSVVGACLFLWWPAVFICLVATLGDRTLPWVRFDWCFVLITGITHTSFIVVPRKLLSSFVPPRCCSFFLRSMPSTCGVRFFLPTFWHSCWIRKNYRFGGSWSAAGNSRDCHGTFFACWWARASLFFRIFFRSIFRSFVLDTVRVLYSFVLSFVRFGHWLQHHGLTGPIVMIIVFSSDAG